MFIIGAAGFALASLSCAFAHDPGMLITSRVAQGLFGAVMLPHGLGMIRDMFTPKEIGAAFGAFGPVMGLSAVGGPILAGWLVTADFFDLGWRMIFLINLPLGVAAVLCAVKFLPTSTTTHATKLDLPGVAILSAGAFMVIFPLVQGRDLGWPLWTYAMIVAGVITFGLFTLCTKAVQRRGGDPQVTPSLFKNRAFTGGLLAGGAFFSGMIGFSLVFSLYLQIGLGYSPLKTGLAGVPQAARMVIGFVIAGAWLSAKLGRKLLHLGLVVMVMGGPTPSSVESGMQATLWIEVGLLVVTLVAAFLLPKTAREE